MNVLGLLADSPLWIAVLVVTVALHVAFVVVVRRLMRGDRRDAEPAPPGETRDPE